MLGGAGVVVSGNVLGGEGYCCWFAAKHLGDKSEIRCEGGLGKEFNVRRGCRGRKRREKSAVFVAYLGVGDLGNFRGSFSFKLKYIR